MPEQRFFVITGMAPRSVQPRDGRPAFTIWEVFDDQGNKWQVRENLYNQALNWFGQRVVAVTRQEQRGNFTNLFADSMELAGAQPEQAYRPVQEAQAAQPQAQPQVHYPPPSPWELQKQKSIHRQTAAKVAAELSQTADEFWSNAYLIYQWFETDRFPTEAEVALVPQPSQPRPNQSAYRPYDGDPGPQEGQGDSLQYNQLPEGY